IFLIITAPGQSITDTDLWVHKGSSYFVNQFRGPVRCRGGLQYCIIRISSGLQCQHAPYDVIAPFTGCFDLMISTALKRITISSSSAGISIIYPMNDSMIVRKKKPAAISKIPAITGTCPNDL